MTPSTEDRLAEEGMRGELTDLERALALRVRKPNRSIVREYDELQFSKDEALVIAAEFAVIRREAASSLDLELAAALRSALAIAREAREEWDKAPSGMRAGKLLIALGEGLNGYRPETDAIHAVLAKATERGL